MRSRKAVTVSCAVLFVAMTLLGQVEKQKVPTSQEQDRIDKAHEGIFSTKPDKAAEASRLSDLAGSKPLPPSAKVNIPRKNFIDEHIFGRIERDRVAHAALANDEEFIRRAYLDATGLLPPTEEIQKFVASKDTRKRDQLIDSLIGTEEFAEQWAWFWLDLSRVARDPGYYFWTKQWLKADRPYNDVFKEIVTITGKSHPAVPAAGFYGAPAYNALRDLKPYDADNYTVFNRLDFTDEVTVDIGRIFLGINMDCFSCHNGAGHADAINLFLAGKTRKDFYRQAAFLGKTRTIVSFNDQTLMLTDADRMVDDLGPGYNTGDDAPFYTPAGMRFPRDGKSYDPAFILTGETPRPGENPRKALARILPSHIQFARATVNLIWGKLMVVGFVEPYDSFDLNRIDPKKAPPKPWTVQPTNPELLDALAEDFRASNFSIHHLIKTIMKSNAYQLSTQFPAEWKEDYGRYYPRRFARVLTAPELADAVAQATDRPYSFSLRGHEMARVKQLTAPNDVRSGRGARPAIGAGAAVTDPGPGEGLAITNLMQAFFQPTRETPPFLGNRASVVQTMLMMASPVVNRRVMAEKGTRVGKLLDSGKSDVGAIEELFLASLSRRPTSEEIEVARQILEQDRKAGLENIQWALLNTPEFLLNH